MNDVKHKSNLWQGFALGTAWGAGVVFFLGTKRGRELLKKAITISENLEENLGDFIEGLEEDIQEEVTERLTPIIAPVVGSAHEASSGLGTVIDKIKSLTGGRKHGKKIFSKQ